jgi:glycosyltransferase involved in cell wall biosynthesis
LLQIPLGVNVEKFRPVAREPGVFRILYAGRLELLKGVHYLLQSFSELKLPNAELWLVGQVLPEMEPILEQFASDRVRVIGSVPHSDLPRYYQHADAFVFPTLNDAFGLVLLEAMASGLPVITTENSAGPDVIDEAIDGFVVPIRSVEALKERLHWLYSHREEAQEMGRRARRKVEQQFTWNHYHQRLNQIYRQLTARSASNGADRSNQPLAAVTSNGGRKCTIDSSSIS